MFYKPAFDIYLVGGAVRDMLLGKQPNDRDYVVVGATIDEFKKKFPNAQLVGNSFPVFLVNGDEYAFARKERKTGHGYKGFEIDFTPDISLEDDLLRRDLTINAIAYDPKTGKFIDPYGGIEDLKRKLLRHVSPYYAEDPLRVYRTARFAAKLPDFSVHPETIELMKQLHPELKYLSAERVLKELTKTLNAEKPSRFFETLAHSNNLGVHFPEIEALIGVPQAHHTEDAFQHTMMVLDEMRKMTNQPELLIAALYHDTGKGRTPTDILPRHFNHETRSLEILNEARKRLKFPNKFVKGPSALIKWHMNLHRVPEWRPKTFVKFFDELTRSGMTVEDAIKMLKADELGRIGGQFNEHVAEILRQVFPVYKSITGKALIERGAKPGPALKARIIEERVKAIKRILSRLK